MFPTVNLNGIVDFVVVASGSVFGNFLASVLCQGWYISLEYDIETDYVRGQMLQFLHGFIYGSRLRQNQRVWESVMISMFILYNRTINSFYKILTKNYFLNL